MFFGIGNGGIRVGSVQETVRGIRLTSSETTEIYCVAKHDPEMAAILRRKAAAEQAVIEGHSIYVLFVIWSEVDTMSARVMSGAELA